MMHGSQKLLGAFGGGGLAGVAGMLSKLGVEPAQIWAWVLSINAFDVGGVVLRRPFKMRRLGQLGFIAVRMSESRDLYGGLLGFKHADILDFGKMPWAPKRDELGDTRGYFMRYGTDHHAFVLFN